ncbi:gamma-glutamylcyclotransferase [Aurantivibrio plasticivorans]
MNPEYLFVYGTLRTVEGHPMHNYLRSFCDLVGDATVRGIKIDLGEYPGLIPSGNPEEIVDGELYRIHEGDSGKLFDALDRYEGCSEDDPEPHEYFRHRLDVTLSADKQVYEAWVYLYNA